MAQEEEVLGKAYDSRLMRRLLTYLRPYRWQVTIAIVSIILKSFCDVLGPYLVKVAVDRYLAPVKGIDFWPVELAQPAAAARDRANFRHLLRPAGAYLRVRVPADLLHAMDRTESDVRPAQPDFPPPAAHARRFLRQESGRPPGHARHYRRGRVERNVHFGRGVHL